MRAATTEKVVASYIRRLKEAGFDPSEVSQRDYTEIENRLWWRESTFKTVLAYLGKPNNDLQEGFREYIPTNQEVSLVKKHLGSLGVLITYLGCRFHEYWQLAIKDDYLLVKSGKGSHHLRLSCSALPPEVLVAVQAWVYKDRKCFSEMAARKAWQRLIQSGVISQHCQSHSFRHRLITKLIESGMPIAQVGRLVGHRDLRSTYRYVHQNPVTNVEARTKVWNES